MWLKNRTLLKFIEKILKRNIQPKDHYEFGYLAGGGHVRIQEGNPAHSHYFCRAPFHENPVGSDFKEIGGGCGIFREIVACSCGAEEVVSHGGFI